jgi:hypothetical protein
MIARFILPFALVSLALAAGCNTPEDVCEDHRAAINAALTRCDVDPALHLPPAWLTFASGPCAGMLFTCESVDTLRDVERTVDECIPDLEMIACEDFFEDGFPRSCDTVHYEVTLVSGDSCG